MENVHRQALLEGRATLERTGNSLMRSQQISVETEQIGTNVIENLDSQKESLLRARNRLVNTDYEMSQSRRIMRIAQRRIIANKAFLILVIFTEILLLICIVYFKFFKKH